MKGYSKNWQEAYKNKLVSAEEAASHIGKGDRIWMTPAQSTPIDILNAIVARIDEIEGVQMASGLSMYPYQFLTDLKYQKNIEYTSWFLGGAEHMYAKARTVDVNSVNLSAVDQALWNVHKVNTLLAEVSPPDENGFMSYGVIGGMVADDVRQAATKVILQVNKYQLPVKGDRVSIHVNDADFIVEGDHPLQTLEPTKATEVEEAISKHIVERIPNGATLASGIGGLANAVAYGLKDAKDISVHSEMFNEALMDLYKKGVLTDNLRCSFSMGTQELYEFLSNGPVRYAPVADINNRKTVMALPKFNCVMSGLMADLTGQMCSESIGFRQYSCTGGQLDFIVGSNMALDNQAQSFLCITSTSTDKEGNLVSNVMPSLPPGAAVTVPRSEVMNIVTEYGIADLRNKPISHRAKEMIKIAHPQFREQLTAEAKKNGLIV